MYLLSRVFAFACSHDAVNSPTLVECMAVMKKGLQPHRFRILGKAAKISNSLPLRNIFYVAVKVSLHLVVWQYQTIILGPNRSFHVRVHIPLRW